MIYYTFDRAVQKSYYFYQSSWAEQRCVCCGFWRNVFLYTLECVTTDGVVALIFHPGDDARPAPFRTGGQKYSGSNNSVSGVSTAQALGALQACSGS